MESASPPAPREFRLIVDPAERGSWNMALDEALLESASDSGYSTLRFYQWSEPTLSLGYFQRFDDRALHPASMAASIVRRSTGGGAILHDRELTYSITLPATDHRGGHLEWLYYAFHDTLIEALATVGVSAHLQSNDVAIDQEASFLCFHRRTRGDVIVADGNGQELKIAGSAQRRSKQAVLQHGSVLLQASPLAPELPGAVDLTKGDIHPSGLLETWKPLLLERLNARWLECRPSEIEHARARLIEAEKFSHPAWTSRR